MQDKKETVWSVKVAPQFDEEFRAVARYRGQTRAAVFRQWIRSAYRSLPEDAKIKAEE